MTIKRFTKLFSVIHSQFNQFLTCDNFKNGFCPQSVTAQWSKNYTPHHFTVVSINMDQLV